MTIIENLIETQEFATLPNIASKILNMLENDETDIRKISEVIEADASLTLKLLRIANSPLYSTKTEINSIHQAIITLGLNRLTNIVLGVSIFSKFLFTTNKELKKLVEKFWWHTACTGMVSKSLTSKLGLFYKETEFIGGLLHDIGKMAMMQYSPVEYMKVIDKVENHGFLDIDAEEEVFGVAHPKVGAEIANLWKLPLNLTNIIEYHTIPSESDNDKELIAIVRVADLLTELWGAGFYEGIKKLELEKHDAWQVLSSSEEKIENLDLEILTFDLEKDFENTSLFLNTIIS